MFRTIPIKILFYLIYQINVKIGYQLKITMYDTSLGHFISAAYTKTACQINRAIFK